MQIETSMLLICPGPLSATITCKKQQQKDKPKANTFFIAIGFFPLSLFIYFLDPIMDKNMLKAIWMVLIKMSRCLVLMNLKLMA